MKLFYYSRIIGALSHIMNCSHPETGNLAAIPATCTFLSY